MHRVAAIALVSLLAAGAVSGCLDSFTRAIEDHRVSRNPPSTTGWNRDPVFTVQVLEASPLPVRIKATSAGGVVLEEEGLSSASLPPVNLTIPDGTWTIVYYVDGTKWESFKSVRFDSTPPSVTGIETLGEAEGGRYTIGAGASVEAGASVQVVRQSTQQVVATSLPHTATGLADGIHAFDVVVRDAAGNTAVETVQVRAGAATRLPPGQHTLGLVARYTLDAELWDISDLDSWMDRSAAGAGAGGWTDNDGKAIDPDDPAVQAVVDQVVDAGMTSGEAAFALFRWMADELDYDRARLEADDLLEPAQTIENGGGVCRDLAALYVSLLRAAGVPARLVTGYLGGEVDGFHAWVEFYGGPGHGPSPWVPVDVSAITGPYRPETALQAFGLRHTDMLPLRVVSEAQEDGEWSTAVAVSARYPQGSQPDVDLATDLDPQFTDPGVLCVDVNRLARRAVKDPGSGGGACPPGYPSYLPDFVLRASQVLDYGGEVASAAPGTTIDVTLSFPEPAASTPGLVELVFYGARFQQDPGAGTATGSWES